MRSSLPTSDLLSRIPLSARSVLDVGCGNGPLFMAYRRMNPKARLLGVGLDPLVTEATAAHLDQVLTADTPTDPISFDVPDGIDCIVYNDVLHHQDDPWALVHRHVDLLGQMGIVLICVANSEYWRLTNQQLQGKRDDSELLWPRLNQAFSLTEIKNNLARADLTLCDVTTREPGSEAAYQFFAAPEPGLQALGIDPKDYARRAVASHLICRARKVRQQKMLVLGNMLEPVGGVSHVRVVHPLQAVGSDPAVTTTVTDRVTLDQPGNNDARIFILHRPALTGEDGHDKLRALTDAGYLVVTEFDDHPEHFQMMHLGGDIAFLGVHAVQTSTVAMAEILRSYNPEVAVFPNALVALPEIRNFADRSRIILFFGALNRGGDWQPLMPVINAVAAKMGGRLQFQVVHDQAFFDALESGHKTFTPTCDYDTYSRILGESDISFMPLADTPFNRAKSDLKFIEAGACRVAALASPVVYGDSIDDGCTGLLFRDSAELHARLLRLIAMPDLACALGNAARHYVTEHRMLAYQVAPRIAWYRSLWIRREALEAARRARIQLRRRA